MPHPLRAPAGHYTNAELPLAGADPDALYAALRFLYTGEAEMRSAREALHLYDAANKLELASLANAALQYLKGVAALAYAAPQAQAPGLQPAAPPVGDLPALLELAVATAQPAVIEVLLATCESR